MHKLEKLKKLRHEDPEEYDDFLEELKEVFCELLDEYVDDDDDELWERGNSNSGNYSNSGNSSSSGGRMSYRRGRKRGSRNRY